MRLYWFGWPFYRRLPVYGKECIAITSFGRAWILGWRFR
jgi:hypothetical protein